MNRSVDALTGRGRRLQQFVLAMLRSSKREQSRLVDSRCTTAVAVAVWLSALVGSAETIESFAVDETLNRYGYVIGMGTRESIGMGMGMGMCEMIGMGMGMGTRTTLVCSADLVCFCLAFHPQATS